MFVPTHGSALLLVGTHTVFYFMEIALKAIGTALALFTGVAKGIVLNSEWVPTAGAHLIIAIAVQRTTPPTLSVFQR